MTLGPAAGIQGDLPAEPAELRVLFHRLNNQLGVILAHAELLEAKATDDLNRARAVQVVSSVLEAMTTAREIRDRARTRRDGLCSPANHD
jgi:hypothetical protein